MPGAAPGVRYVPGLISVPTANVPSPGTTLAVDGAGLPGALTGDAAAGAGGGAWTDWVLHAARSAASAPRPAVTDLRIMCLPSRRPVAAQPQSGAGWSVFGRNASRQ